MISKNDLLLTLKNQTKTKEEREGLEKMISMMLCLKKHDRLKHMYKK